MVVDARSSVQFAEGHIPGAVNIPHRTINEATTRDIPRDVTIVTYCAGPGCNASTKAALRLATLGFRVKRCRAASNGGSGTAMRSRNSGGNGRIALATGKAWPDLAEDDHFLVRALKDRGWVVRVEVWDSPGVDWARYDVVLIRSCWDYHLKAREFLEWTSALERDGTALWNAPAVVEWNHHKRYLLELAAAGIPVVPTCLVNRGEALCLKQILDGRAGRMRW